MVRFAAAVLLLLTSACSRGAAPPASEEPAAPVPRGPSSQGSTDPMRPQTATEVTATVRRLTADLAQASEGGPVPEGEQRLRLEFSEPVNRESVERLLRQDVAPERIEWDQDEKIATVSYHLPAGKALGICTGSAQSRSGIPVKGNCLTIWARGQASLWRMDPSDEPRRLAEFLDRFEAIYAAPGGQALLLYSTQEWEYLDFVKTFIADPGSGDLAEAPVPVRDLQAPPPPRWWKEGALITGVTCCPHLVNWTGSDLGGVSPLPERLSARGSGVSPDGQVAVLVSPSPDRESQPGVDLQVGDKLFRNVTRLPLWPKNRGDTHYWPHVQVLWQGEDGVLFPDLDSGFRGEHTWQRMDLASGQPVEFPLLHGYQAAYPSADGRRFFARGQAGWAILEQGRAPLAIVLPADGERRWAPPIWSADGEWVYFGPYDIKAGGDSVTTRIPLEEARLVARDARGTLFWIQTDAK